MSESGASDTSSDDNDVNVGVAVEGSAFTGGGCDVLRGLSGGGGIGGGRSGPWENQIVESNEGEHGANGPSEHVRVHHFERNLS